jgi:hypothetical protein
MSYQIEPTRAEDCPELGQFLARGFGLPAGSPQAAVDVLAWKYLQPRPHIPAEPPRSYIARDESGRIIGHIGSDFTTLRIPTDDTADPFRELPAQHIMDWLAAKDHPGVGAALMRRAHAICPLQYALAATPIARKVALRLGYADFCPIPIFKRIIRPSINWRPRTDTLARALARTGRDALNLLTHRPRRANAKIFVRQVDRFGPEVDAISQATLGPILFTGRHAANLNALLAYPRPGLSAWLIEYPDAGGPQAFAVLSLFSHGGRRVGKIAELLFTHRSVPHWHAAYVALARVLVRQGAHEINACAGTPWEAQALALAGFRHSFDAQLIMRNHENVVPPDVPFHIGFIEADYAYNP